MKIGFTGTRLGMSEGQTVELRKLLQKYKCTELHHGDCIGADVAAHHVAHRLGIRVIAHPPKDPSYRAYCMADEHRKPLPYIHRNHNIVDETEMLLVAPRTNHETLRSGTWATYRYAMSLGRRITIIER